MLFRTRFGSSLEDGHAGVDTAAVLAAWQHLPEAVLRAERRRRAHVSAVLSRNEVDRDYTYNRGLFKRIAHGWYQLNPKLSVRGDVAGEWRPLLEALNLPYVYEFAHPHQRRVAQALWSAAGREPLAAPIAAPIAA